MGGPLVKPNGVSSISGEKKKVDGKNQLLKTAL